MAERQLAVNPRDTAVLADLATFLPYRDRPLVPARAFEAASGPTERVPVESEDAGLVLLRFRSGARWQCPGRCIAGFYLGASRLLRFPSLSGHSQAAKRAPLRTPPSSEPDFTSTGRWCHAR